MREIKTLRKCAAGEAVAIARFRDRDWASPTKHFCQSDGASSTSVTIGIGIWGRKTSALAAATAPHSIIDFVTTTGQIARHAIDHLSPFKAKLIVEPSAIDRSASLCVLKLCVGKEIRALKDQLLSRR